MIKNVVRSLSWDPKIIENLYLDDMDFRGLEHWSNDAVQVDGEIIEANETDKNS